MHTEGPIVVMTCTMCGSAQQIQTLLRTMLMPGESIVRAHIFAPILIHTADGGHMAAHPAMPTDTMESA